MLGLRHGGDDHANYKPNYLSIMNYLYAYTGDNSDDTMVPLLPSDRTKSPLFDKVIFCNAREDGDLSGSTKIIGLKAYGIQSDYLRSSEETETKADIIWQLISG